MIDIHAPAEAEKPSGAALFGNDWPRLWIEKWEGSGPQRGSYVMEQTIYDLGYERPIAFLGEDHAASTSLVMQHNRIVEKMRAAMLNGASWTEPVPHSEFNIAKDMK